MNLYLESAMRQFKHYKMLGDKSISQVSEDSIHWMSGEQSNSIATIVKHMRGNMLSRWTDFLHSDGEKPWRNRDDEFTDDIHDKEDLIRKWQEGWKCLFNAIEELKEDDLESVIYIRNQGHTVVEAINRQLAHYAYHVGQIVFLAKMITGGNWEFLSIPPGKSAQYNEEKFSEDRNKKHFTDEYLDE
jgi:hypothetical protein